MHAANIQSSVGRLREAFETLRVQWLEVREHWQDANAVEFEERQLQPLGEEFQRSLPAMAHLAQVIAAAERELADPEPPVRS